jgi:hypothetical protein
VSNVGLSNGEYLDEASRTVTNFLANTKSSPERMGEETPTIDGARGLRPKIADR